MKDQQTADKSKFSSWLEHNAFIKAAFVLSSAFGAGIFVYELMLSTASLETVRKGEYLLKSQLTQFEIHWSQPEERYIFQKSAGESIAVFAEDSLFEATYELKSVRHALIYQTVRQFEDNYNTKRNPNLNKKLRVYLSFMDELVISEPDATFVDPDSYFDLSNYLDRELPKGLITVLKKDLEKFRNNQGYLLKPTPTNVMLGNIQETHVNRMIEIFLKGVNIETLANNFNDILAKQLPSNYSRAEIEREINSKGFTFTKYAQLVMRYVEYSDYDFFKVLTKELSIHDYRKCLSVREYWLETDILQNTGLAEREKLIPIPPEGAMDLHDSNCAEHRSLEMKHERYHTYHDFKNTD